MDALHDPKGEIPANGGFWRTPRFDGVVKLDLDVDGKPEKIIFSKPPLEVSMRTAKYALMFIVFTFMAFFLSEVMNRLRVHPVQYVITSYSIHYTKLYEPNG